MARKNRINSHVLEWRQGRRSTRPPRQERAHLTVEAILQAAEEVLVDKGYAAATTNRIAERAGVSIGSLYQYFSGKDAVFSELLMRHHKERQVVVDKLRAALKDPTCPLAPALAEFFSGMGEDARRQAAPGSCVAGAVAPLA